MARDVLGMSMKRGIILLAVMFLASGLSPEEPGAQTAATNGMIVYSGYDPDTQRTQIYTMNPDGTGVTNITATHTDPNWAPHIPYSDGPEWSPDGTKISASGSSVSDVGNCCSRNVYVMDADGTNVQRLTNTPSASEGWAEGQLGGGRAGILCDDASCGPAVPVAEHRYGLGGLRAPQSDAWYRSPGPQPRLRDGTPH